LKELQDKGTWNCGHKNVPKTNKATDDHFVETLTNKAAASSTGSTNSFNTFQPVTKRRLVEVLLQRMANGTQSKTTQHANEHR
jgi:hypothetical protein